MKKRIDLDTEKYESIEQVLKKTEQEDQIEAEAQMKIKNQKKPNRLLYNITKALKKVTKLCESDENGDDDGEEKLLEYLKSKYCGLSFNYFRVDNPVRLFLLKLIENPWFDRVVILVIAINSCLLAFNDYTWNHENGLPKPMGNHLVDDSELFFTFFFLLEFIIKVICQGIVFADGCYFRDGWNWLDFIVVVTAILQVLPKVANVSAIRMFRFLRPLRTLSFYPSMKILANTLFDSLSQLINIVILDSIFIFIFSILALQLWGGVTNFRCRQTPRPVDGDWPVVVGDVKLCGGYKQCADGTYCGSLYETYLPDLENPGQMKQYYLSPNVLKNLNRDSIIPELNYGITNFDNVTSSFLTTFQCTTLEGWFQIMEMIQDSFNIYLASFFFIALIIMCFYFLLNLTVAVMLDNFKELNQDKTIQYTQKYENNRIRVQNLKALHSEIQDFEDEKPQYLKQIKKIFKRNFIRKIADPRNQEEIVQLGQEQKNIQKEVSRYDYRICRIAWNIIRQPIFNHLVMLLIIINSIALASDSYPQNDIQQLFQDTNIYFSIGIFIEQILKLIGLTWKKYIKDKFNIIDFVIIFVSIVELIFSDSSGVLITIRTFRLIRLIKLARSNNNLKILLDSIAKTLIAIGNFLLLLTLFIYIFALLGMSQFAGSNFEKLNNNQINHRHILLRTNFDSIQTSLITVFQVMLGEDWNFTMYEVYQNVGNLSYVYFILLIIFGKTILLNLFLSILLGNFELSSLITRAQEEDMRLKRIEKRIFARNLKLQEENLLEGHSSSESFSDSLDYQEDINMEQNREDQEKQTLQTNRAEEIAIINKSIIQFRISEKKRQSMFVPQLQDLNLIRAKTLELMPITDDQNLVDVQEGQVFRQPQTAELAKIKFKQRQTLKISKSQSQKLNFDYNDKKDNNFLDIKRLGPKNVAFDLSSEENSDIIDNNEVKQIPKQNDQKDEQVEVQQILGTLIQNNKKLDMQKLFKLSKPIVKNNDNQLKTNQIFPIQYEDKDFDFENSSINSSLNLQQIIKNKRIHAETQLENNKRLMDLQLLDQQSQQQLNDCNSGRDQKLDSNRKLLYNCDTNEKLKERTQVSLKIDIKHDSTSKFFGNQTLQKNENPHDELLDKLEQSPDNLSETPQCNTQLSIHSQSKQLFFQKILSYLKSSSLFIFHKDTKLRQLFLKISTKQPINKKPDQQKQNEENVDELQNDNSEDNFANLFEEIDDEVKDIRIFFGEAIHVKQSEVKKEKDDDKGEKDSQTPVIANRFPNNNIQFKTLNDSVMIEKLTIDVEDIEAEFENVILSEGKIEDLQKIQKRVNAKVSYLNRLNAKGEIDPKTFNDMNKKQQEAISKVQEIYDVYLKRLELKMRLTSNKRCQDWFLCVNWSLNTWFENFIQLTILCSLMILINDVPNVDPNKQYVAYLKIADRCCTFIFIAEAFVRIVALGFFYTSLPGQKAYIMDSQNRIDFFVCICCDLPFQIMQTYSSEAPIKSFNSVLRSLKVLRSLRALRILRVISKSEALRIAVGSLFEAMPSIINGLIICSLFIFIFAIIGVNFFKGAFSKCIFDENKFQHDEIKILISSIDTSTDCLNNGGSWINSRHNFDNVLQGMSILYQIITTEGWLEYMYAGIDSRGPDLQPKKNYNLAYSAYFISFMLIGNIFIFKLFVGIVIEKFSRLKDKSNGFTLMTRDQRNWLEQEKSMLKLVLKPVQRVSEDFFQQNAINLLNTEIFRHFLSLTIICNFLIMSFVHYQQSDNWKNAILKGQIVLIVIYNFEAVVKIVSKKQYYFYNFSNKFDFFIVVFGNIIIIVRFTATDDKLVTQILNILMVLPLIRIFRIINAFYQYKVLIGSLKIIFPAVANVGFLILLIIFMFAVIGMNMFSNVIHQKYLNENMNFNYFGLAVICLIRCMTGEKWNFIMDELAIDSTTQINYQKPDGSFYSEFCLDNQSYDDVLLNGPKLCGNQFSYIYFSCFIIVIQMMMLNLFIAVVLEGFSSANKDFTSAVTNEDYKNFLDTWLEYDPDATGWLTLNDLVFFLNDLPAPFNKIIKIQDNEDQIIVNIDYMNKKKNRLIDKKDRFLLHGEKNFIISHKQAMTVLNDIKIPVFKGDQPGIFKVHFCFVVKRLTHKVMMLNNPDFDASKMSIKHLIQSQKKWEETYPDLVKDLAIFNYDTGRIFAGLFILMCCKTLLNKKKMLIQGDAYNLIKKERQVKEERENQLRKAKIFQQIKRERLQKKSQIQQATIFKKISRSKSEEVKQSKEKLKPKSSDITKLLRYKKKPKTDDIIILEKKNKKRQDEMEREEIDREFIKNLNDQILKLEKNKKSFKKLSPLIQRLIIQQLKGNMKISFQQLVDVQKSFIAKEDEQRKWNDPNFKKDFERSTWFLKNNERNIKMKQWVQNFYVKERFKKLTINNENFSKISQIKDVDKLLFLERNEEQEHEPQDHETFQVVISDEIQDYDPKKVPRKKKPKLLEVQNKTDLFKKSSEPKKDVQIIKNFTQITINNLDQEQVKQELDKNQEIKQDFQALGIQDEVDKTWKQYPQGEVVSSIELSNESIQNKSILSSLDEIDQVKVNLNIRKFI